MQIKNVNYEINTITHITNRIEQLKNTSVSSLILRDLLKPY